MHNTSGVSHILKLEVQEEGAGGGGVQQNSKLQQYRPNKVNIVGGGGVKSENPCRSKQVKMLPGGEGGLSKNM